MARTTPRELAHKLERRPRFPTGAADRFAGYGVLGLPFTPGDILAFRRFTVSSIGPAYTSVWHRDPDGRWTVYTDTAPELACPRYFRAALARVEHAEIELGWTGGHTLAISIPEHQLDWAVRLEGRWVTSALNFGLAAVPRAVLTPGGWRRFGRAAAGLLDAGSLELDGRTPGGHTFRFRPTRFWLATAAAAVADGRELGPVGPHGRTTSLGGLVIPDRGLFAAGEWAFESRRPSGPPPHGGVGSPGGPHRSRTSQPS